MAAFFVWLCIVSLAITKIGRSCVRFKEGNYYQAKKKNILEKKQCLGIAPTRIKS